MDIQILKSCLSNEFFEANKGRLKPALFEDELRDLFEVIHDAHEKYSHDLTADEVLALWKVQNPVATRSEKASFEDLISTVEETTPLSTDIAQEVITGLWKRELGRSIASLGIDLSEGREEAVAKLKTLLERTNDDFRPDDFGEATTDDLEQLLAEASDDNRWQFNISTLSNHVYGIGPGEFGIIFARPETGKSTFGVSIAAGPDGFCEQGARVLYLGNEEKTIRTKLRAYQAYTGMTVAEIRENPVVARRKYSEIKDNLIMKDTQEWDLDKIEAYIAYHKPDVVIVDQADKVMISGAYDAGHERLRELYRRLRETAKRYDCAVLGVSQASADAEGRTRLTFAMMEGSKTGKAAEADLIIGIGKHAADSDGEPDYSRFITVSKNKLSGWHGTIVVQIQPEIGRYAA